MRVWVVMAKVSEMQTISVENVFDSKEKANKYVREQKMKKMLPNLSGFEHTIEARLFPSSLNRKMISSSNTSSMVNGF
jgi:hypothetical protein